MRKKCKNYNRKVTKFIRGNNNIKVITKINNEITGNDFQKYDSKNNSHYKNSNQRITKEKNCFKLFFAHYIYVISLFDILLVRYHCGGWPEEVNSCFLNSYMVYLSTTFIPIITIIHIYNWYHSITTSILLYTRTRHIMYKAYFPLLPFAPLFHLLGTLLAVTGSVHLVPRLLVN